MDSRFLTLNLAGDGDRRGYGREHLAWVEGAPTSGSCCISGIGRRSTKQHAHSSVATPAPVKGLGSSAMIKRKQAFDVLEVMIVAIVGLRGWQKI